MRGGSCCGLGLALAGVLLMNSTLAAPPGDYALAMGLREGWLPDRFRPMARRAWSGLAAMVDHQGAVHEASPQ